MANINHFHALTMKCNEKAFNAHHLEVYCVVVEGGRDTKHSAAVSHVAYVRPSATEKHFDVINGETTVMIIKSSIDEQHIINNGLTI